MIHVIKTYTKMLHESFMHPLIGYTNEIHFQNGGFLYEALNRLVHDFRSFSSITINMINIIQLNRGVHIY